MSPILILQVAFGCVLHIYYRGATRCCSAIGTHFLGTFFGTLFYETSLGHFFLGNLLTLFGTFVWMLFLGHIL